MDLSTRTETFGQDDQSWLGSSHGTDAARSITLDTSGFTAGTHYPDGFFLSGLPLGRLTATGKYVPYNGAAADGSETLQGFLLTAVKAPSSTTIDVQGALLIHGVIVEANLPVAIDAGGKTDLAGRFYFA
jgi:hypothetical protein